MQQEQARLQVLNNLLAGYMTTEQAATLMGVSTRHTRRILTAYRKEGATAIAHGNRGRRPANATPETISTGIVHLARTRYAGVNHTHMSEKTCSNAISSTGVRRRPPVPGMNRVSTNSARMIPCHHLKRHLGRSVCDSKSLMPGYCGTVDEPNESGREVLYVKIRSGDLRGRCPI